MFHATRRTLIFRYLAGLAAVLMTLGDIEALAAKPEYLESYTPAKGFKPAQRDLTEVFLQLAGSLEAHGSPEPYLRHVAAEHRRVENLYRGKSGKAPRSYCPSYMTDAYLDKLSANWNLLSPKLGLDAWARETGHLMRNAIKGTRGTGTTVIEIFNHHQTRVFDEMAGKGKAPAEFEQLKAQLIDRLELDNTNVDETSVEIARRDAVTFALGIHGITMKLFKRLDEGLNAADAERVKAALTSIIMDTGRMAHSELQAGLLESALETPLAYNPENERRLSAAERKQLAAFLQKARFTKSDFAELDRFYQGPYDRLTDEGKDEMSKRVWNGTRR